MEAVVLLVFWLVGGGHPFMEEKKVMLITDSKQLVHPEKTMEFSHTAVLILHKGELRGVIEALREHREISYNTKIAFSEEKVDESVSENKKEITKQLKALPQGKSATIRDFLLVYYGENKAVKMPVLSIKEKGKKKEIHFSEFIRYEKGKKWQSLP